MSYAPDFDLDYAIQAELARARRKFPSSEGSLAALTEEVGELAKAVLDESRDRIIAEAVQVAAMAIRVAIEGDPTLYPTRHRRGVADWAWGSQA